MRTKIFLVISIASAGMMMPFVGRSQNTEDKIWINRADALRVKAAADSFKIAKFELQLLRKDLSNTTAAIGELKTAISKVEKADSLNKVNLRLAEKRDSLRLNHIALAEANAANWEKMYRRESRRRAWTGFAGVITTIAAILIPMAIK